MINMQHNDGDTTIMLTEVATGKFEVTLHQLGEGDVRVERHDTYLGAVREYLQMISYECACWDQANAGAIEALVP